jgi:hypothetical protein
VISELISAYLTHAVQILFFAYSGYCIGHMQVYGLRLFGLWFERGFAGALTLQIRFMDRFLRRGWPFIVLFILAVLLGGPGPSPVVSIWGFCVVCAMGGLMAAMQIGFHDTLVGAGVMTGKLKRAATIWGYGMALLIGTAEVINILQRVLAA